MGSGGSGNLLRPSRRQTLEPEFQLKQLYIWAWASNEKKQRMLCGCSPKGNTALFKGNTALLTEVKYVLFAPFLGELTPTWNICSLQQRLFWFSKDKGSLCGDSLWEAKVLYSFWDHKTLFNKIPQAQPPKNYVINLPSKQSHLVPLRPLCCKQR